MEKNNKIIPGKGIALLILLVCMICTYSYAQTDHPATLPDTLINGATTGLGYVNNAVLDYSPICPTCTTGKRQLRATVVDGVLPTTPLLIINDGVNPIQSIAIFGATPDVIITNDVSSSSNSCYIGIVVAVKGGCPFGPAYDVDLIVYHVSNMGIAGSLTVSFVNSYAITAGSFQTANLFPHIDVISAYNNLFPPTGPLKLPQCDTFVISYTDAQPLIPGGCGVPVAHNPYYGVNLYCNSMRRLIATGLPLFTINDSSKVLYPDTAMYADVAAVEKVTTGVNHLYAYFTYTDANGKLYESEWHPGAATLASTTLLHTGMDIYPRIDAIDDININGGATLSRYMVVDNTATGFQVVAFDPVHYIPGKVISGWPATINDIHPVVTCGTNNNYTVGYYHDGSPSATFMTQMLNWTTPVLTDYYEVNLTALSSFTTLNSEGLSSTCNNNGLIGYANSPSLFGSWLNMTNNSVYEKTVANATAWKPVDVSNVVNNGDWQLWPNPANSSITIAAPDMQGRLYSITDIAGRELKHGMLSSNKQQINVTSLANGMYLLHIYTEDKQIQTLKFVKE